MKNEKTIPCKCGAEARIRYKAPYTWVECKKKCGMRTGVFMDWYEFCDPTQRKRAVAEWNRMVQDGKDGQLHQT